MRGCVDEDVDLGARCRESIDTPMFAYPAKPTSGDQIVIFSFDLEREANFTWRLCGVRGIARRTRAFST